MVSYRLVGSPVAGEGSRTGFYGDEFDQQTYRAPGEIRKANLCGADLRNARIEGTDFYLVDLRRAKYTREQFEYLRRGGTARRLGFRWPRCSSPNTIGQKHRPAASRAASPRAVGTVRRP